MPRPNQLPPLTWIRAFCEAARHGSFKSAAEELSVSPSTISHEIRKLEEWTQTPLFDRSGRAITLTAEGEKLRDAVLPAFDGLAAAFDVFSGGEQRPLRIGMFPFLASEFFVPRLAQLEELLNGQTVKIISTTHLSDLSEPNPSDRLDAVIRYGESPMKGFHCTELTRVHIMPVVAANTDIRASAKKPMKRIRMENAFEGWKVLKKAGISLPPAGDDAIVVDNYLSGLRAVEQGLGIGIALLPLAASWIADGRLGPWSDDPVAIPERYWFVTDKNSPHRKTLDKVAVWLSGEFDIQSSALFSGS